MIEKAYSTYKDILHTQHAHLDAVHKSICEGTNSNPPISPLTTPPNVDIDIINNMHSFQLSQYSINSFDTSSIPDECLSVISPHSLMIENNNLHSFSGINNRDNFSSGTEQFFIEGKPISYQLPVFPCSNYSYSKDNQYNTSNCISSAVKSENLNSQTQTPRLQSPNNVKPHKSPPVLYHNTDRSSIHTRVKVYHNGRPMFIDSMEN